MPNLAFYRSAWEELEATDSGLRGRCKAFLLRLRDARPGEASGLRLEKVNDRIMELKVSWNRQEFRFLFFNGPNNTAYIVHFFQKKREKLRLEKSISHWPADRRFYLSAQQQSVLQFTDLGIADELRDKEFRDQFFRAEREIDIPAQLKTLRKFRGMTQKELAACAGTKQSAISRIEKSQEVNWELETLVKLAEALDARLAVTIEPYEVVAARHRSEAQLHAPSAATERFDAAAPRLDEVPREGSQALQQNQNGNKLVGEREGAVAWN